MQARRSRIWLQVGVLGQKNRVEFVARPRTVPAAPPRFRRERNMKATQRCGLVAGLLMVSVMAGFRAQAGDYPEKVVQIIEDSAAGSTPDVALRFVADELGKLWGQQVLVVSHPGAGGSLAVRLASEAAPDGGPAHAISDVATGRVSIIIEGYSGIAGAVRSGLVNLIAVASAKRLADFPNVPTVSETIPDFLATGWGVLVAPQNTPQPIIQKVSADLSQVTSQSDLQKNLAELGSYTRTMTPAETTVFVHQQQNIWDPVLVDIAQKQQK